MTTARTLFEKIWASHVVVEQPGGHCPLYVDRHLIHYGSRPAFEMLVARPGAHMAVDLARQLVTGPGNASWSFKIDPFVRTCLLTGQGDIDLSLRHVDAIAAFEAVQSGRSAP